MMQSLKRTVVGGLALAAAVVAGAACTSSQQPPVAAAATTAAALPTTAAAPTPSPVPATTTTAASVAQLPDVEVALIDRMDSNTVSWTDGKLPATNASQPTALPGPEHKHTAMLASNAVFYLWDNRGVVQLDAEGLGTVPSTKEKFIQAFIQLQYWNTKISFNGSGQVIRIAARYEP